MTLRWEIRYSNETKNAREYIKGFYINIMALFLHISATFVAILRGVQYKGRLYGRIKAFVNQRTDLNNNLIIYSLKYILKV